MKVGVVLGTRPEIMKNYPVVKALRARGVPVTVLHTNQHDDSSMSAEVFEDFGYGPELVFEGRYQMGAAIDWVRREIRRSDIDLVVVNGDTAAALVGAVAAIYSDAGLAHVEAGLRSFDKEMYEERNRIMVDAAAHYLFTYTEEERRYLERVPELRGRVFNVGNTTVDVIAEFSARLKPPPESRYAYVTLHRKELTDRRDALLDVLGAMRKLSELVEHVIFPVHPRTRDVMRRFEIPGDLLDGIEIRNPLRPLVSLSYEKHADLIVTDSGCVQEEAYLFGVPCVTVRPNTERRATVEAGANVVCGYLQEDIIAACRRQLLLGKASYPPIYGAPGVGDRLAEILVANFRDFRRY